MHFRDLQLPLNWMNCGESIRPRRGRRERLQHCYQHVTPLGSVGSTIKIEVLMISEKKLIDVKFDYDLQIISDIWLKNTLNMKKCLQKDTVRIGVKHFNTAINI